MRELCCSIVSEVIFRSLFLFLIFQFGIVGATFGAITGAVIGWSNKKRLVEGVIVGAVSGAVLSYNLTKYTFDYLLSDDDDGGVFLVHIVKLMTRAMLKILCHEEYIFMGFSKASFGKGYSFTNLVQP